MNMDDTTIARIRKFDPDMMPTKLPYNKSGIELLENMDDIVEFNNAFTSVTTGLPTPIRLGSSLRVAEETLVNWGIKVTDKNREELRKAADALYTKDDQVTYTPARTENDRLHAFKRQLQAPQLEQMKTIAALQAANILRAMKGSDEGFNFCHLASEAGDVVMLIAGLLRSESDGEDLLKKTVFHIVDWPDRIALAYKNLSDLGVNIKMYAQPEPEFFASVQGKFDFVISISQLHRKPFLSDYLKSVRSIMKDSGVFIAADWHSSLTLYPSHVYNLLEQLGLEDARLNYFSRLFGPLMYEPCPNATPEQINALADHKNYWTDLATNIPRLGHENSLRVRIMSAFLTHNQLRTQLDKSGFDTDRAKIATAFPSARLPSSLPIRTLQQSDTAVVTLGMRRK